MITDRKLLILKSLDETWKSTKALIESSALLADRNATSLLLNLLKNEQLVKKCSNGYWNITPAGQDYLKDRLSGAKYSPKDMPEIPEKPEVKPPEVQVPAISPVTESEPKPEPEPEATSTTWDFVSQIMQQIPEKASFVIERGSAFIVFASAKFRVQESGDIEAVLRAAELYSGRLEA